METEIRLVATRRQGRGNGEGQLMGMEFLFRVIEMF